jgi:hypothetical protein
MFFSISSSDYNKTLANITRVKVHLRTGIIEVLDNHQDLLGNVENDFVEVETISDNKKESFSFVLQEGIFIVSTKGLEEEPAKRLGTTIYIYARRIEELNSQFSFDAIVKEYEEKLRKTEELRQQQKKFLEFAKENPESNLQFISGTKLALLESEVKFLEKLLTIQKKGFKP